MPSVTTIPPTPTSNSTRRPIRSMSAMATTVITTLMTPMPTVARIEVELPNPVDSRTVGA
jgi:hypothetical protein